MRFFSILNIILNNLTHYLTPTFRIHFSIFYPNIFDQHKLKSSPSPQNSPLKYTSLKNPIIDDSYTSMVEFVIENPTIYE